MLRTARRLWTASAARRRTWRAQRAKRLPRRWSPTKGYHTASTLAEVQDYGIRTYIPERNEPTKRRWRDKPREWREAFFSNRRRVRRAKGRRLQRLRAERLERSFAHVCVTGAARRTWLRGVENVQKRYVVTLAAKNLGLLMRVLFGIGSPRSLQGLASLALAI